jgi:GxxExxY protein
VSLPQRHRDPQRATETDIDQVNAVSAAVIGAAIEVHRTLGPGFLESIYEEALCVELAHLGVPFARQADYQVRYRDRPVGELRLDLVADGLVVVELKAVDALASIHEAQILAYLKATNLPLGLLINFNVPVLTRGMKRIAHRMRT